MKRFEHLLVVAAQDPIATTSLLHSAVDLARSNNAAITVLSVVDGTAGGGSLRKRKAVSRDVQDWMIRIRSDKLEETLRTADLDVDHHVVAGVPHLEILNRVAVYGHDLVLVAEVSQPKRSGWRATSTATHLVRKCPVPVWVHSPGTATEGPIAVAIGPVGVDETTRRLNVKLLKLAGSMAKIHDSRLHIVHAWRLDGDSTASSRRLFYPWAEMEALATTVVTEARAELDWLIDRAGLDRSDLSRHVRNGHTVDVLIAAIRDINPRTFLMGTSARAGIQGLLLGNTAERVIGAVNRPVLVVKPQGFRTRTGPGIDWDPTMLPY